ncbi:MAG TPA: hypothetical protein VIX89_12630 [Bryobacteraceae bacterium]
MNYTDIFSDEFDAAVKAAIREARAETLKAGASLFYRDSASGLEVMEQPDGRIFEIRYLPGEPRDRNYEVLRELVRAVA